MFVTSSEPNNYYYDLTVLSVRERLKLSAVDGDYEGVWVAPSAHRTESGSMAVMEALSDCQLPCTAIAVPGLGCSLHGAASLARQVANVIGEPVVAPVSSRSQQNLSGAMRDPFGFAGTALGETQTIRDQPSGDDAERLAGVLARHARELRWLVGYSRGGWLLAHAWTRLAAGKRPAKAHVAIFGGVVSIDCPPQRLRQYLGEMDLVGSLHSALDQPYQRLPFTGHHLNPALPGYIDLPKLLAAFVAESV